MTHFLIETYFYLTVPKLEKCVTVRKMGHSQRNGSQSEKWVRVRDVNAFREMCQSKKNVRVTKTCPS